MKCHNTWLRDNLPVGLLRRIFLSLNFHLLYAQIMLFHWHVYHTSYKEFPLFAEKLQPFMVFWTTWIQCHLLIVSSTAEWESWTDVIPFKILPHSRCYLDCEVNQPAETQLWLRVFSFHFFNLLIQTGAISYTGACGDWHRWCSFSLIIRFLCFRCVSYMYVCH